MKKRMKQALSVLLAICLTVVMLPLGSVIAYAEGTRTTTSGAPAQSENVYQLSSADDLLWFVGLVNGTLTDGTPQNAAASATLTEDITIPAGTVWTPIGAESDHPYSGTFDGQEHTISGLSINATSTEAQGLFGYVSGTVRLVVVNGNVTGTGVIGGIVGNLLSGGLIERCVNKATVSGDTAGGIVGKIESDATAKSNINAGTITGITKTGGVCGENNGMLKDTVDVGIVSGGTAGFLCGQNNGSVNNGAAPSDGSLKWGTFIGAGNSYSGVFYNYSKANCTSGELCNFMDTESLWENNIWRQTLTGESPDTYPVPFGSHAKVYDYMTCFLEYAYTNDASLSGKTMPHAYDTDGTCTVCGVHPELVISGDGLVEGVDYIYFSRYGRQGYQVLTSKPVTFTGTAQKDMITTDNSYEKTANITLKDVTIKRPADNSSSILEFEMNVNLTLEGNNVLNAGAGGYCIDIESKKTVMKGSGTLTAAGMQISPICVRGELELAGGFSELSCQYDSDIGAYGGLFSITGGTIRSLSTDETPSNHALVGTTEPIIIDGGSIFVGDGKIVEYSKAVNTAGDDVYLTTVTLEGVVEETMISSLTVEDSTGAAYDYGIENVYTDEQGKLYFYLPEGCRVLAASTAFHDYTGDVTATTDRKTSLGTLDVVPPTEHQVIEGANGIYTIGDDTYTLRVDGSFNRFTGVEVDGNTVPTSSYDAESGSTVITFHKEFMDSLAVGDHTFVVNFTDGAAETTVTVKAASNGDSMAPKTGDNSGIALWTLLTLIFAGSIATIGITQKKRKSN